MTESTELIAKRAAYAALEAAITLHVERMEKLAAEARALGEEITALEQKQPAATA